MVEPARSDAGMSVKNKPVLCRHGLDVSSECLDCNPPPKTAGPDLPPMPNWPVAPDGTAYTYAGCSPYLIRPGEITHIAIWPQYPLKVLWVWLKPGENVILCDIRVGQCSLAACCGEIDSEVFTGGRFIPVDGSLMNIDISGQFIVSNQGYKDYVGRALMVGLRLASKEW
jgi:hypothetical protein